MPSSSSLPTPLKSVEGWILIMTNVNPECQEDDVYDQFGNYGTIKSLHLNLDRKTGYVKGYALIEYTNFQEAEQALKQMNGATFLDKQVRVDWAFQDKPIVERKIKK